MNLLEFLGFAALHKKHFWRTFNNGRCVSLKETFGDWRSLWGSGTIYLMNVEACFEVTRLLQKEKDLLASWAVQLGASAALHNSELKTNVRNSISLVMIVRCSQEEDFERSTFEATTLQLGQSDCTERYPRLFISLEALIPLCTLPLIGCCYFVFTSWHGDSITLDIYSATALASLHQSPWVQRFWCMSVDVFPLPDSHVLLYGLEIKTFCALHGEVFRNIHQHATTRACSLSSRNQRIFVQHSISHLPYLYNAVICSLIPVLSNMHNAWTPYSIPTVQSL